MSTSNFSDDIFPPVRSAVNAYEWRGEIEGSDAGLVRFEPNFSFDTTVSANDGTIFGLNEEIWVAIARHL